VPPVGQLILDPQGEYANPNTQDGTELAAIGVDHAVLYKFKADRSRPNVRPLGINFFDPAQIDAVKALISTALADASSDYVRAFVTADFDGVRQPDDSEGDAFKRLADANRGRLLLYGALARANLTVPQEHLADYGNRYPWRAWVSMKKELVDELERQLGTDHIYRAKRGMVGVNCSSLATVLDWLIERSQDGSLTGEAKKGLESFTDGDAWRSALPIYTQENSGRQVSGYTKLKPLQPFHTPVADLDFRRDKLVVLGGGSN
jgi:hypothetical protein